MLMPEEQHGNLEVLSNSLDLHFPGNDADDIVQHFRSRRHVKRHIRILAGRVVAKNAQAMVRNSEVFHQDLKKRDLQNRMIAGCCEIPAPSNFKLQMLLVNSKLLPLARDSSHN